MLEGAPVHAIVGFRRRVAIAQFLTAAIAASFAIACALTTAVVVMRVMGWPMHPSPWWGALAILPLAWGAVSARRRTPGVTACASYLDHRLELGGLLMTSCEADARAWRSGLETRLRSAPAVRPPTPWRRSLGILVAAAAVLVPAFVLPEPASAPAPSAALPEELRRIDKKIALLSETRALDEPTLEALRDRSRELSEKLSSGEQVGWGDVDALSAAVSSALEDKVNAMESLRDQLDAATGGDSGAAASAELAALLEQAEKEGLLGEQAGSGASPADQKGNEGDAGRRAAGEPGSESRGAGKELTREDLERLAKSLSQSLTNRLKTLAEAGLADPEAARRASEASAKEASSRATGHRHTKACRGGRCCNSESRACSGADGEGAQASISKPRDAGEGQGGVSEGRGDAALRYLNDTEGERERFKSEKLPSGAGVSRDWTLKGVGRAEPTVRPEENTAAGGAGGEGTGDATGRRRLAPRHRDTVRRFFSLDREGRPR